MFGIFGRKKSKKIEPVVCARADHCISRKNIDPDALKVLYRLSSLGYVAYLVGGGVRDLLLGRQPKDFDVGTSAKPNEVKRAFRNCFLIGRRFRLAHVRFGQKVIETATFRQNSQTVGEIIEHAAEGPLEDNTFGTPETDAYRRDFTVNGLFYNIKDFSVIDYVGGLKDLKKRLIRSIGDPMIRFREDPVRMMRAIKFSARLDFVIERKTGKAIRSLHSCILTASVPRLCEELFRLFSYGTSEKAFRMLWNFGLMGDLLPDLAKFIDSDGGEKSATWKYLAVLDRYERAMHDRGYEVTNGLTLESFQRHPEIDRIVLVCIESWMAVAEAYARQFDITKLTEIVPGGASRRASVYQGLKLSSSAYVIVHDAARPFWKRPPVRPWPNWLTISQPTASTASDAWDANRTAARTPSKLNQSKIIKIWEH